jgi:hypothetical protein
MRGPPEVEGSERQMVTKGEVSRTKVQFLLGSGQPCHPSPAGGAGSHGASLLAASGRRQPAIVCQWCCPGAAARNTKISLRFISTPSCSFEILAIGGESYFNPLVPISLITVSIDNGQDSK